MAITDRQPNHFGQREDDRRYVVCGVWCVECLIVKSNTGAVKDNSSNALSTDLQGAWTMTDKSGDKNITRKLSGRLLRQLVFVLILLILLMPETSLR